MRVNSIETVDGENVFFDQFSILVGPNNVGKTQTLSDMHNYLSSSNPRLKLVEEIDIDMPDTYDEFVEGLNIEQSQQRDNYATVREIGSRLGSVQGGTFDTETTSYNYDIDEYQHVLNALGEYFVAYLDASSRLEIAQSGPPHNAHEDPPGTLLQALYEDDTGIEESVMDAFRDTFNMEIRFDYTALGELSFKISDSFPEISDDPKEGRGTMMEYEKLDVQGHGFRSFIGVILGLLLVPERIVLLDEPAAFLHPPQARRLGNWVASNSELFGQVFIATHNSDFISGILQGTDNVDVYRLNRPRNQSTHFHRISSDTTKDLSQEPLLSSQRVVGSIFHRGVVVVEGGSDRSVYRYVATSEIGGHLPEETLFIDALGVGSIKKITGSLSGTGIPVAAVADLDVLNDNDKLRFLLESMNDVSEYADIRNIMNLRGRIDNKVREEYDGDDQWETIKEHGVDAIPNEVEGITHDVIDQAREHGLFIVPAGELEGWMNLGVEKPDWPAEALNEISDGNCNSEMVTFIQNILNRLDQQYESDVTS